MNSLYGQYEIGYPQLESRDQATGASFGLGLDKALLIKRPVPAGACGGALAPPPTAGPTAAYVALSRVSRVPRRRGGHYGTLRARQVRRPAVCNLLQERARACQKRSSAVAVPRVVEQKPRSAAPLERRGGGQDCPLRSCSLLSRSSASLTLARRASK